MQAPQSVVVVGSRSALEILRSLEFAGIRTMNEVSRLTRSDLVRLVQHGRALAHPA
ncbi:MAG: hypothetical protein HY329_21490 [Chloroflexi bacterium]|nr:hypothetical protein [Chloroflexota bacterium]